MTENYLYSDITEAIIKCYYKVYNKLGYGFLEKVYERAMLIELGKEGFICLQQCPVDVYYETEKVGYYLADIIVNGKIIVEIKAAEILSQAHETQLTNYLKATEIEVGLLLNFGKKPAFKRRVFSSEFKS
ncbi:MAG TPA: GxxExxY protein [Ferruginibacter sp.]|nr:GxxExxY protein [Ferruginibacter sp.]